MMTLNRFASVLEALPHMDPVDPCSDRELATRLFALSCSGSPAASPQA